jgi:hypothetical protein
MLWNIGSGWNGHQAGDAPIFVANIQVTGLAAGVGVGVGVGLGLGAGVGDGVGVGAGAGAGLAQAVINGNAIKVKIRPRTHNFVSNRLFFIDFPPQKSSSF